MAKSKKTETETRLQLADEAPVVECPECGNEQADMGRNVSCEECEFAPMPCALPVVDDQEAVAAWNEQTPARQRYLLKFAHDGTWGYGGSGMNVMFNVLREAGILGRVPEKHGSSARVTAFGARVVAHGVKVARAQQVRRRWICLGKLARIGLEQGKVKSSNTLKTMVGLVSLPHPINFNGLRWYAFELTPFGKLVLAQGLAGRKARR